MHEISIYEESVIMKKQELDIYLAEMINEIDLILETRKIDTLTRQEIKMFLYVRTSKLLKKLSKKR